MGKSFGLFAILLLLLCAQSCGDDENLPAITVSTETLDFPSGKSTLELEVSATREWKIWADASWCTILGAGVVNEPCKGKVLTIKADENNSLKERETTVTISETGGSVRAVTVRQRAADELAPRFKSFRFRTTANPGKLPEDVGLTIAGTRLSARTSFVVEDKVLVPEFEFDGGKVYAGTQEVVSGKTEMDFSGPVVLTIRNKSGAEKEYTVELISFTGLPVVYIDTKGVPIDSKEVYVPATIRIVDNNGQRASSIFEETVHIKGRGNSTWLMPKKPYRLKFDKKQSLLGEPKDKSWVLLANYMDDDCGMRNATAYSIGHLSCMDFTPTVHFVEVFLNGRHNGLYQLCEHMKISEDRVNVTDEGYLIEAEQRDDEEQTGDVYFWAETAEPEVRLRFCIKDPDVEKGSPAYDRIRDYVNEAQNALYGSDFKDPEKGYAKYLNVDTYVDWYVISEITKTNDAALYTSCYMNIAPGGKLNMGPMWDYDICIGNSRWNGDGSTDGYWNRHSPWFARMLEDPVFVQKVKERIRYFKANLPAVLERMDVNAEYVGLSVVEDNRLWEMLGPKETEDGLVRSAFLQDVQGMRNWLMARLDWLDQASFRD